MPALLRPQSAMQEPESPWTNSFKSSLGKRQREGEDDAGRLTTGMNGIMSMATMPTTTTTMTMHDVGYGNGSRDMMGIAVHQVHQESNGSTNRFGMKRLKSTSDQPNSFSTPSYSSLPFTPTPPTWLATQSPFASSSTTPLTQNPHSPNPFFPSSSASTPGLPSGNPTLQNPIDTYGYAAGYSRPSQSTDYVLATGSLRLESPYPPPTFDHQPDSSIPIHFDDMDMDNPYSAAPNAPPPSLYSMQSASSSLNLPESGPSTQHPHHQTFPHQPHAMTPQRNPSDALRVGTRGHSISPHDGYAEPYWRDGIKGLASIGPQEEESGDGSPSSDPFRRAKARGVSPSSRGQQQHLQQHQRTGGHITGEMDLGRSVAMAMGMGMDSRMSHGDAEMDVSPVFSTLRLPQPSPVDPNFDPTGMTDVSGIPTTPVAPTFDNAPSAPVNTPATTPTRQNAVPHLIMTGCQNKSRYSMGPRADCDKCRNRIEGHVAHWK